MEETLRRYNEDSPQYLFYKEMHENQTLEHVLTMKKKYEKPKLQMSIQKALSLMDDFIDPSDPDLDVPNSIHAYQTAERCRKQFPNDKDLQITCLIHDLGKVLFHFGEPNWNVVGDTYVVGCDFSKRIVYPETFKKNPEYGKYDECGIYEKECGIEKLHLSYGHDEYLYNVLKRNKEKHKLGNRYLNMIRFHSFYPWHTEKGYQHFNKTSDEEILNDVLLFNSFDLYSKEDECNITNDIKRYYDELLNEYFLDTLEW